MNVGLLLAAGGSTRMGQPKQLLPWQGSTLLDWTIDELTAAGCDRVCVVLGADSQLIREQSTKLQTVAVESIQNPDWRLGQSSSLVIGLERVVKVHLFERILIAVCDQPFVTREHYASLLRACCDARPVAATQYEGGGGVPACLTSGQATRLVDHLSGDTGAKLWIRSRPGDQVFLLRHDSAEHDLDSKAAYRTARNQLSGKVLDHAEPLHAGRS